MEEPLKISFELSQSGRRLPLEDLYVLANMAFAHGSWVGDGPVACKNTQDFMRIDAE